MLPWLLLLICAPLCEPAEIILHPVLHVSPSQPVEGHSMTLTCKVQLLKQKSHIQFCFFCDWEVLGSGCSSSPTLQIPAMWRKNPASYSCKAEVPSLNAKGWSRITKIHVQRIPVSDVNLETRPPGGWVMEGSTLVLKCTAANATGNITYLWYRGALGSNLKTKTQHSLTAEFEITEMKRSDAEQYYCAADNGYGPVLSEVVNITVRVPVSRPVLTFGDSGTQAALGDLVELHCEALRGSPPIFYQFYHENIILGNSSAPSGGGASFNFSLTAEHSGNYSCEASNGQDAQRSEVVTLNLTGLFSSSVPFESGSNHFTSGVMEWLLGSLGPITISALIFCYWFKRKIGRKSDDPPRKTQHHVVDSEAYMQRGLSKGSPARPVVQESGYLNSPDQVYENVNVASGDDIYSLVYHSQQELEPAAELTLTPVCGQYETAPESVMSVNPPWTAFFQGETVTLACSGSDFTVPQKTKWYFNKKPLRKIEGHILKVDVSGEYQCQASNLHLSAPVRLHFYKGPLILQAPPVIFEGDSVALRCHTKESTAPETLMFYKDNFPLQLSASSSKFFIHHASLRNSGEYYCKKKGGWSRYSNNVQVQVKELFPRPVLTARPSQPIDGSPVTLVCQTQLPAQRSKVQLQFCFFRNLQALKLGCSNSTEFHIPVIWTEDSMWYQCRAETMNAQVTKQSLPIKISVQRALADLQVHIVPYSTSVFEGQLLLFSCSVKGVPGPIKFSWYTVDKLNKETKILKSSEAEFTISRVSSSDSGDYYCEASNSRRSFLSKVVPVTIKVPASQPVLTLSTGKTRALEGDLITLYCKSQKGSPPIQYEFYYEDVFLDINTMLSGGGGAFFNFSMTAERSGNYSCTADNGLGAQRSEAVWISVIVPVSRPVLTLGVPEAQVVVGDVVELLCEALEGSPPILYHFYHQNVTLGSSSAPFGGKGSFNFSATAEHFGNFFCEADNGRGPQLSDTLALSVRDTTKNRSVSVAAGITSGLLIMAGAVAGVLFYCWFSRKAGEKPACNESRNPSYSEPQEPTYYNVPAYIELQPVYSNEPKEEVIYTEVRRSQQKCTHAVQKSERPRPRCQMAE
ncbi:Fc receptor 5 [Sigmodon hispidus]